MESNTFLSNQWVKKKLKEELQKKSGNKSKQKKIYQNLWNAAKAILRRKFTALNTAKQNKTQDI